MRIVKKEFLKILAEAFAVKIAVFNYSKRITKKFLEKQRRDFTNVFPQ